MAKGIPWPENAVLRSQLNDLSPDEKKELAAEYRRLKNGMKKGELDTVDVAQEANGAANVIGAFADRPLKGKYAGDEAGMSPEYFDYLTGRSAARFTTWVTGSPEWEQEAWAYSEGNYDFTVCQRKDGSLYGTGGKCRKGTEVSEDQAALQRASNRKRKTGRYGGSLKQRLAKDPEIQHLARQHRKLEKVREKTKGELKRAAEELEQDRWNATKRESYRKAEQRANAAYTAAERSRSDLKRREREIRRQHLEQNRPALPKQKGLPDYPPDWPTGRRLI